MKPIYFVIVILALSHATYCQSLEKEEKFIAICKAIASVDSIRYVGINEFEGNNSLFFLSDYDFISDKNNEINLKVDDYMISIWFRTSLFFYDIPYWIEVTNISNSDDGCIVKFRGYNSGDDPNKRSVIIGEIKLAVIQGLYKIIDSKISYK